MELEMEYNDESKNNVETENINNTKFDNKNKTASKKTNKTETESKDIDLEELCENGGLSCNFSVNSSNQANLVNTYNTSHYQVNSVFIMVPPYFIDKFSLEGLNLDVKTDGDGNFLVNGKVYTAIEVEPGIKVFGVSKSE